MSKACRCDSKPCAGGCPCFKAKVRCTSNCHGKRPWSEVPCLNTETGLKVKEMKPAEVRKALCDAALSPVGDKVELQKRLAVHFFTLANKTNENNSTSVQETAEPGAINKGEQSVVDLMEAILANEGDFIFILSLSGRMISPTSSKGELRKAYFLLSSKIHPDKNSSSAISKKAFQAVLESFERLANPDKFEDESDDDSIPTKRKKTERYTRNNRGCFITQIGCPRCQDQWKTKDLGLEDHSYNFIMQGLKQYLCGGCFAKFGCMTAIHLCPHCKKTFEYDPDDYHKQITCGNKKCDKTFGFWMFNVSERRVKEIQKEVKEENEKIAKTRAQQRRRNARADKRIGTMSNEDRVKEQLFVLRLLDNCPRCGWLLQRGMDKDDARDHLNECNDQKAIKQYQKQQADILSKQDTRKKEEESQEDLQAYKTWEYNGRQVGQLWMLSDSSIHKECNKYNIPLDKHPKHVLISKLGRVIRDMERKMITMGGSEGKSNYDITPIHKVDSEDLPTNLDTMTSEELQCVAASYGLDYDHENDVKIDLLKKLETARLKGTGLLMILEAPDEPKYKRRRKQKKDPDYKDLSDSD